MANAKPTAIEVRQSFDKLTDSYQRIFKIVLDAMAPNVDQKDRDELRKTFAPLAGTALQAPGAPKPGVPGRDTSVE